MCLNFRKRLDWRLYDGYWIIDVSIGNDYKIVSKNRRSLSDNSIDLKSSDFNVSVFGKLAIGLKCNGKHKEAISKDCKVRLLSCAKYQSMTSRPALKNKFISTRNNTRNNSNNSNNNKNNSYNNNTSNCFSFVKFNNNDRKRISCNRNYSNCLPKLVAMQSAICANNHSCGDSILLLDHALTYLTLLLVMML